MGLQDFIRRAKTKESKKVKIIKKEIEDMGVVEFVRPKEEVLIEFLDASSNGSSEDGNINDFKGMVVESSRFLYMCCPFFRDEEFQREMGIQDPFDTAKKLFSPIEIVKLAGELNNEFNGLKAKKDNKKAVKNS